MSTRAPLLLAALVGLAGCAAPVRTVAPPPAAPVAVPVPDSLAGRFAVYTAEGRPADLAAVLRAMGTADAVFLGEQHDDAPTHRLQRVLLEAAHAAYGARRPVALGLEMAERDVQLVLDEYLAGTIRERDYLAAARPWANYAADYRPLVEYAREHGLPVIAANAPGRYVNLVSREGEAALAGLDRQARAFLPPLPVAPPSGPLATKFRALMEGMAGHTSPHGASPHGGAPTVDGMLAAQNLRDAAMAEALARWLAAHRGGLVLHLNGVFHSEAGLGVPEHLARYRRGARALVVSFRRVPDPAVAPAPSPGDDFLILTRQPAGE